MRVRACMSTRCCRWAWCVRTRHIYELHSRRGLQQLKVKEHLLPDLPPRLHKQGVRRNCVVNECVVFGFLEDLMQVAITSNSLSIEGRVRYLSRLLIGWFERQDAHTKGGAGVQHLQLKRAQGSAGLSHKACIQLIQAWL